MIASTLAERLAQLPAVELEAVELYRELREVPLSQLAARLTECAPDIEEAALDMECHVRDTRNLHSRCDALRPAPSQDVPDGM